MTPLVSLGRQQPASISISMRSHYHPPKRRMARRSTKTRARRAGTPEAMTTPQISQSTSARRSLKMSRMWLESSPRGGRMSAHITNKQGRYTRWGTTSTQKFLMLLLHMAICCGLEMALNHSFANCFSCVSARKLQNPFSGVANSSSIIPMAPHALAIGIPPARTPPCAPSPPSCPSSATEMHWQIQPPLRLLVQWILARISSRCAALLHAGELQWTRTMVDSDRPESSV